MTLPFGPDFATAWNEWLLYKKECHKFRYKTQRSELLAIKNVVKLSGENEQEAVRLIEHSISMQWKGIYYVNKPIINATTKVINGDYKRQLLERISQNQH